MTPNILKYSNGWGHLLISISTQIVAVILLLKGDAALTGVAIGLLVSVSGYWFISSAAHAQQAATATPITVAPPATPITVAGATTGPLPPAGGTP